MPVDWSTPQPSYEQLHAQIDALATERNSAVAEARLWLRRLLTAQQERDQALADLRAAEKAMAAWQAAYDAIAGEMSEASDVVDFIIERRSNEVAAATTKP